MFLKEKYDGNVKGKVYADGKKQQEGCQKKDAISPTVALVSVLITSDIDV